MNIWVSCSTFLKQIWSVRSGLQCRLSKGTQHVGATVSVLCDIRTMHCAVSKLHLHTALPLFCKQFLVNVGMLERCVHITCNCDVVTFWAIVSITRVHGQHCFSWTTSMVSMQTSWAECARGHDGGPSEPIRISRNRLSLDRTMASVSLVCQRPVVMTPISLSEFSSFCRPFFTSWGSSRIVRIFVCLEPSL